MIQIFNAYNKVSSTKAICIERTWEKYLILYVNIFMAWDMKAWTVPVGIKLYLRTLKLDNIIHDDFQMKAHFPICRSHTR